MGRCQSQGILGVLPMGLQGFYPQPLNRSVDRHQKNQIADRQLRQARFIQATGPVQYRILDALRISFPPEVVNAKSTFVEDFTTRGGCVTRHPQK